MDFTTAAWIWLYVRAFLMLAELASPGFVIFFFGLGAATPSFTAEKSTFVPPHAAMSAAKARPISANLAVSGSTAA